MPYDREWALMLGSHAEEWDPRNPGAVFTQKGFRGEHHGSKVWEQCSHKTDSEG